MGRLLLPSLTDHGLMGGTGEGRTCLWESRDPILIPALHEWQRDLGQAPQPSWPQPLSAELGWC